MKKNDIIEGMCDAMWKLSKGMAETGPKDAEHNAKVWMACGAYAALAWATDNRSGAPAQVEPVFHVMDAAEKMLAKKLEDN